MDELVKWLKENVGDSIRIITPQFERTEPLVSNWKPTTKEQCRSVLNTAPWWVLEDLGFRKWASMNNLIAENKPKPRSQKISIPIINVPNETYDVEIGRQDAPTELLEKDEDVILIPGEWYGLIPDGFYVTGLYGESYPFKHGDSDDDIRYGCLAYGIRRIKESK